MDKVNKLLEIIETTKNEKEFLELSKEIVEELTKITENKTYNNKEEFDLFLNKCFMDINAKMYNLNFFDEEKREKLFKTLSSINNIFDLEKILQNN